jgi:hypothetical protein
MQIPEISKLANALTGKREHTRSTDNIRELIRTNLFFIATLPN